MCATLIEENTRYVWNLDNVKFIAKQHGSECQRKMKNPALTVCIEIREQQESLSICNVDSQEVKVGEDRTIRKY